MTIESEKVALITGVAQRIDRTMADRTMADCLHNNGARGAALPPLR